MKIVGFEANGGLHLGVVEGDNVVDLQAMDAGLPADLGEVLRRGNGDLKPLAELARKAPAAARRPTPGWPAAASSSRRSSRTSPRT